MDIEKIWGLSLASIMFLTSTLVQCQNQTSAVNATTVSTNSSSPLEEIVPGSLRGSGDVFSVPDLFGGEPFSLHTDPITGQVDFQTRTVDVKTVNEARDREESQKVAELRDDLQSRVPSAAHLPLEARDEEYVDAWGQPIKRGDLEYYDEEPEAREPIMVPQKTYTQRPATPPKEEESLMSIFESLFGGGGEEDKTSNEVKPTIKPYRQPYPTTTPLFTTENVRTTTRQPQTTTERRPPTTVTTERHVYQQYPERYSNYQQPPERPHSPPRAPERYNPYQQVNRPSNYQQQPQRPNPYQREPEKHSSEPAHHVLPERQSAYQPKPVRESANDSPYPNSPQRKSPQQREPEKVNETQILRQPTPAPVKEVHHVTPERPTFQQHTEKPYSTETEKPTTEAVTTTKSPQNDWQTVENKVDNKKGNIDRQDWLQNEVKPTNPYNTPEYFNFINLPVHYSTKDTAIPLISTSYANTKVQGMGASKYEKNNGKYSNHKYDASTTTRRPSYWSTKRPPSRPSTTKTPPEFNPVDFTSLEYDDAAIGSSANFGGYGNKAGVKIETTQPPTRPTPTRTTFSTTLAATTSTSTTTSTTTTTKPVRLPPPTRPPPLLRVSPSSTKLPLPVKEPPQTKPLLKEPSSSLPPAPVREYEEYDYESYPAQVKPVSNPTPTSQRPADSVPEETKPTNSPKHPKEPEYEYYDYDTEAPVAPPTTTTTVPSTTTQKFKLRYPSLPKDKIKRPEERVEVVVPTKTETTSQTSSVTPSTTIHYFQRPTTPKDPAPVFEEHEESFPLRTAPNEDVKPIIVTAGNNENENVNIVLVPAKTTTEKVVPTTIKKPEPTVPSGNPSLDYTTEFTVGVVHGQGPPGAHRPGPGLHQTHHQGQYVASSIAASPFEGPDEPFRPIARPAGMSASFQVVGEDVSLEQVPQKDPEPFRPPPAEPDVHEPHEFIPSPQFHRPELNQFVIGTSFNTQQPNKPANPYTKPEYYHPQPPPSANNEILTGKPKPQRPIYTPPASGATDYYNFNAGQKPNQNFVEYNRPSFPQKPEETYKKPTNKPVYQTPKPTSSDDEDYGFFDVKPDRFGSKPQTNVELSVDYDFDGIQTEPKPGQYVIFPKPQLNSEINENQVKKTQNTPIPHYHENPGVEPVRTTEIPSTTTQLPEKVTEDTENQMETLPNYPRPHWEKNGKPSFLVNSQGVRNPQPPPQMSQNLIPPANFPPKFRKPVSPSNLPPTRKTYNEANFHSKPKPNLPNILPQFRPNAKIGTAQRPYRPIPPNRRKENFPYRIQNEPDTLMHRDFQVDEEIIPKFISNRVRLPEFDQMMIQKRMGLAAPPPAPRRVQRTPVTTLQMLQQNQGIKRHQAPSTREDQADPSAPLIPPVYKPYKEEKKDVYVVYPVKTPFNSNIKIEDPDKIDYNFNQTSDQVPLLKPSKKKEKPVKPDFPYGFVTPNDKIKVQRKEPQKETKPDVPNYQNSVRNPDVRPNLQDYSPNGMRPTVSEIRPNIQDYMPSPVKMPLEKQERIDMNLHMQSNNQWNQVSNQEVITQKEDPTTKVIPPTQYHTLLKNTNASEFTLGAVMHTLPDQNRKGQVTSVNINEDNQPLVRPGLNVNERIANGKIVTVSMPVDVKEEKQEPTVFQAPFQASSTVQSGQGWNILEHPEGVENLHENVTESANTTFNIENFTPELIGGFKPIYTTLEPDDGTSRNSK